MLVNNETGKRIHFGARGMSDYTIHHDDERKNRYLQRHKSRENWSEINPGSLSRWILWEFKDLNQAINKYAERFNI